MALQTLNNYSDDSSLVATDMIDELQQILMIYLTHWVIIGLTVFVALHVELTQSLWLNKY